MIRSFRKMGRSHLIPVLLAVTWLPYISTRCVMNPLTQAGCGVLPAAAAEARPEGQHSHGHSQHAATPTHHDDRGSRAPVHTCCDLTGKCDIKVSSPAPSVDPVAVVAALPALTHLTRPSTDGLQHRPVIIPTHGPPPYLRNVTLLI